VYSLDVALLMAGTKWRGEFEERLKAVMDEVISTQDVIIFVDEVHNLVGAGASEGNSLDAANIFKPALARGQLHLIGATTVRPFRGPSLIWRRVLKFNRCASSVGFRERPCNS
jgi:ATP-dependent Clp protease ATP-binding subunit ClpB